jgi:hypothetical protein
MLNKFIKAIKSPSYALNYLVIKITKKFPVLLPDRFLISALFYFEMGYKLDLMHPKTFNEKLQWLKLYQRDSIMTKMVDKYEAKQYVAERIGEKYIIPTLGFWDSFDKIDFEKLPNQFVLKTTHDSGGVVIVRDKSILDRKEAREILMKSMKHDYYQRFKEWPYKNVVRRIIAEKYMEDESGELRDYKFFCFDGKVKALFIGTDRFTKGEKTKFDFFDENFNHLPFTNGYPNTTRPIKKPGSFDKMKEISEVLSKDLPHLRVDLYEINGDIYFGELTFTHFSGLVPFKPNEWDNIFGEWIKLPNYVR